MRAVFVFAALEGSQPVVEIPDDARFPPLDDETLTESFLAYHRDAQLLFGELPFSATAITSWGYVGLPLVKKLSADELAAEWAREGLITPEQREKAVDAWGPSRDGVPVYVHFTGSDVRGSDRWATPSTMASLLRLLSGWFDACRQTMGPAERCTVQVGDLAWYNAMEPDPLGHQDHSAGTCVDVRLFRTDGSRYEAFWNKGDDREGRAAAYDGLRTSAFVAYALSHSRIESALFNDPDVLARAPGVTKAKGHDDHVHLCFSQPAEP